MTNQQDPWNSQQRPLGQQFNRQHPPVLPPPATLETGGQSFYPLHSLPSLGNGTGHPPGHGFNIPSINTSNDVAINQQHDPSRQNELRRPSAVLGTPGAQLPLPGSISATSEQQQPPSQQPQQPHQQSHHAPAVPQQPVGPQSQVPLGVPNRASVSNVYRPLNVKDALSYLDQVKIQFYNQADVYNNFLDIMKDFKSQSIDTPGVIDRVSTLFKGHPNLIQGFNTFLPPGYRIECSLDPSDPNPIRVTTPTGTTTRPNIHGGSYGQRWGSESQEQQQTVGQFAHEQQVLQQQQQQNGGGQIEFNHAISYVNKIKTRFANQPDIYKQFLEILQTYQREQKPIGEVYEQVTVLFSNSPDLLDDFKQFLPDTSNQGYQAQEGTFAQANGTSQLPPVGNFQPPTGTSGLSPNGSQQHAQGAGYPPNGGADVNAIAHDQLLPNKKKSISDAYAYENNYNQEAQVSSMRSANQPRAKSVTGAGIKNGTVTTIVNPTLVPGIPEPVPPSASVKSSSLLEELSFFDKVKKAIGNRQSYNDFLKILNLYSQDIIDKRTLVERADSFLGDSHPELLNWFKMFVGYEDKPQSIENITFKKHQLELSLCKAYGPSYRQLPKAETFMPCSGRDEMCWEVLNDEWVGHPTWASEDSGFIAHRKNQYEEILFKIEEERLEFDYYMESNLRTIQPLETIANRIANMTPEQKANFKLPPGLGHNSTTIYKKVIRKIYDKDRGFEVIDALHENPAVAVPIVLKRLKQKDEEWKRAQREWNKVWREMEQKVFHKSLDHLGLTFKQADKKLLTVKQLVSEISTVKVEQQNKRLHPLTPKPQEQLNYVFNDHEVLMDILRLADVFIFKSSNYSANDREKLGQFFQSFVSLFFGISNETIDKSLSARGKADKSEEEEEGSSNESNDSSEPQQASKKRGRENDLLRDVLKKQSKSKKENDSDVPESNANDSDEQEFAENLDRSSELWIKTANTKFNLKDEQQNDQKREKYNLFCNTTIYVFFRHLRTLYERLEEIKSMNKEVGKEIRSRKTPQFAKDLNLLSHQLEDMGVEIVGSKDCYLQVLDLSEKLIEGEVEHQWFEESLRQGYRNKAYRIYTIDKVVQAMVKHMHTMVSDSKTSDMIVLFEGDRSNPTSTAKDQILYRMKVRSLMASDENMFKISFKEADNSVNIQFVSLDDLTINDHENSEEQYNYYVTSFVMSHPTEGVAASKINMPFARSFIESVDEDQCDGRVSSGLKVSVCENSYRLFFEANTLDEFTSNAVFSKQPAEVKTKEEKVESLKALIDGADGWKKTLDGDQDGDFLQEKTQTLFDKGFQAYKDFSKDGDVEMKDAEEEQTQVAAAVSKEEAAVPEPSKPIVHDADSTVIQDNNDTTIHQDANDTTNDETTVNQDDASMIGEVQTETTSAPSESAKKPDSD
ncbi:uncharacterized protein CANTADRAFT_51875 [Suhomyces tanzawaensis NRRL Y-17324]|uniref:Histone deacetylase interacting domain-containing protein n=1 Tax=Suhomyces tanzawaensis NRRL Y-17324 TaxID=984487 RepID=A0A1E4SIY2_9ASCO|nr:uncharacterized protein CANTADRAFT_51875 [Suhomyces tanzawaensis NRRL Y-17324]ODV79450.1 hypothetical protein CANTADRAFT_51875 [Suhomyces tanzawaensis NRRL Y-17324]